MNECFMKRAIDLANLGAGFVNPDPLSGAVIVNKNKIIGEGYYKSYGAITSENEALLNASGDLNGAELYLTIEPFAAEQNCYEFLRLLREKGIKKIYIGMQDPNPSKRINFISELKKIGIRYEFGLCGDECEELNEIYS